MLQLISFGRKNDDDPSGVSPIFVYEEIKVASVLAIAKLGNDANERPAPAATPLIDAIIGAFKRQNLDIAPCNEIINSFTSLDSLLPEFLKENKSPPAQKDLSPEPVRIIAFTFVSSSHRIATFNNSLDI